MPVRPAAYHSRACWFDGGGENFVAFLVFGRADRVAIPYFISTRCVVSAGYSSYGMATIDRLRAIPMVDSYDVLQRAMPEVVILSNVGTDQARPSAESILYYFKARVTRVHGRYVTTYAPLNIIELTEMNIDFGRFLGLSGEQRERLASQYDRR